MKNIVKNYELIENNKNFAISYSLLDCDCLMHGNDLTLKASELGTLNYDLVFYENQQEKVIFKNFPNKFLEKLTSKRLLLVGFSDLAEIKTVNTVSSVQFIKKNQIKIGV